MPKQNIFGNAFRQIREDRDLTLRGYASILEFSPAYINDLEKGNRMPSQKVVDAVTTKIFLTEEEHEKLLVGFYTSHHRMPADLIYYIEKNKLLDSLMTMKQCDSEGKQFKQFVKTLSTQQNNK